MGMLVDGKWTTAWYAPDAEGRFVRPPTVFRSAIRGDGSTEFAPAADRYHLYVSLACPWAHRVLLVRALLGLEDVLPISVVAPDMADDGWTFDEAGGAIPDPIHGARFLRDVYLAARSDYTGRVTVPVLWDKKLGTIVSNESREIIRMLGTEMLSHATRNTRLWSAASSAAIDAVIDAIYEPINNGVYRCGFARTQSAYEAAGGELFAALDHWDGVLATQRWLCGEVLTEADICLFTTLVRFDLVYHGHFKCNLRRIQDYSNLWGFVRDLYGRPEVAATCDFGHIKRHYYWSHESVNPTRIVPIGPAIDFAAPHDRARLTESGGR